MITGPLMSLHGRDHRLRDAVALDVRSMRVECPQHKGVLVPVTGLKFITKEREGSRTRDPKLMVELLCVYCNRYHYVSIAEGSLAGVTPYTWHE